MKDYTEYKKFMENESGVFKSKINPTLNNSAKKGNERLNQFIEILPKDEKHMDEISQNYFKGQTFSHEELIEFKAINNKIYNDFIDYCKIPGLSKKDK